MLVPGHGQWFPAWRRLLGCNQNVRQKELPRKTTIHYCTFVFIKRKFCDVPEHTKEKLHGLFEMGHNASSARHALEQLIAEAESPEDQQSILPPPPFLSSSPSPPFFVPLPSSLPPPFPLLFLHSSLCPTVSFSGWNLGKLLLQKIAQRIKQQAWHLCCSSISRPQCQKGAHRDHWRGW